MLRSILLPVVLALVVGLAGSAGYAVMHARTTHAAHVVVQDSLSKLHADSVAADSVAALKAAAEDSLLVAESLADSLGMLDEYATPADSIRALVAQRAGKPGTREDAPLKISPSASPPLTDAKLLTATKDSESSKAGEASAVAPSENVRAAAALPEDILPERRLAKIFSAMSARDAAKVLEQMSDSDVRTILSMMGDRQAAAVLSSLPAPRAALITKGGAPASGSGTP